MQVNRRVLDNGRSQSSYFSSDSPSEKPCSPPSSLVLSSCQLKCTFPVEHSLAQTQTDPPPPVLSSRKVSGRDSVYKPPPPRPLPKWRRARVRCSKSMFATEDGRRVSRRGGVITRCPTDSSSSWELYLVCSTVSPKSDSLSSTLGLEPKI